MEKHGCELSIIVPVYNERNAAARFADNLKKEAGKLKETSEIIFVNDGSSDGTREVLKDLEGVKIIHHSGNSGYGSAIKTGIKASRGEWIIIIDADSTYRPEDMKKLLSEKEGADMVVGLRLGEGVYESPLKRPAKWFLRKLAGYIAGENIPDLNSGLRLFRKVEALKFWKLFPDRFSFTSTITMCFVCNSYTVKYAEVDYLRRVGKSKISPTHFFRFFSLVGRLAAYFNPLKIFIPLSLFIFLLGIFIGFYSYFRMEEVMDVTTVVLILSAVQIFIFGVLADLIERRTGG